MAKIRILGPTALLDAVLRVLQDLGVVHLAPAPSDRKLEQVESSVRASRKKGLLSSAAAELDRALEGLGARGKEARPRRPTRGELLRWIRLARATNDKLKSISDRETSLEEERALIAQYDHFFSSFSSLLEGEDRLRQSRAYYLVVRAGESEALVELRRALRIALGDRFTLHARRLPSGEDAVLLLIPKEQSIEVEKLLAGAALQEMPVRSKYGSTLAEAMPVMRERAGEIPKLIAALHAEHDKLAAELATELAVARASIGDLLIDLSARALARRTARAFVLEGWTPASELDRVEEELARKVGREVAVERISEEAWRKEEAPVVLSNPPLFRPFEEITRMLPLPRYGTIDPTPFVAVFFPGFFGLILGDLGLGALLGVLAALLHHFARPKSRARSIAKIAGSCALFTMIFGALYGEFFGDLGHMWFGLSPLVFDRAEAITPYLVLAIAIGFVHIAVGLVLGIVSTVRHEPKKAIGRGATLVMVVLIALAILAAVEVLPSELATPAVIALLAIFPVLIAAEGIVGAIELLSVIANILSYARIMALGTASVMMAIVANRMAGSMGSAAVGILFALLFHLVNFALGLFSPTLHALRLHYVEFFGKFYSPGGAAYEPFGHWHASEAGPARAG